jgi:hypothetical protein
MLLSDLFAQLTYAELSQIKLGGAGANGITKENQLQMLQHVNAGLTELHTRYHLKEGTLKLALDPTIDTYVLSKAYAVGNRESRKPVKYILDSVSQPFLDTVLKIERVYDEQGRELELNTSTDRANPLSQALRTPNLNTIVVPPALAATQLTVVYRANHPRIVKEDNSFDPSEVEIDLAPQYENALVLYIASRVFNPIGLNQEFHDGNNYWAKFEAACANIGQAGLELNKTNEVDRMERGGWA